MTDKVRLDYLPADELAFVRERVPVVCVDVLVVNPDGEFLLGRRQDPPAQGSWFMPGGRLRKWETLEDAAARVVREEVGIIPRAATFRGVEQQTFPVASVHNVVVLFEMRTGYFPAPGPMLGHSEFRWFDRISITQDPHVHRFVVIAATRTS